MTHQVAIHSGGDLVATLKQGDQKPPSALNAWRSQGHRWVPGCLYSGGPLRHGALGATSASVRLPGH